MRITLLLALTLVVGCGRSKSKPAVQPDRIPAATPTADRGWKAGAPKGYVMVLDDRQADSMAVSYHKLGERFNVTTGPAHVIYAPSDTLSGLYVVATTFVQIEKGSDQEGFGVFVGGSDIAGTAPRSLYFLVRGSGDFAVKIRDGGETRDAITWTTNKAVSRPDAAGRASYRLAIQMQQDSVHFLVNSVKVATLPRAGLPTDGLFGIRLNRNLNVRVDAVRRTLR